MDENSTTIDISNVPTPPEPQPLQYSQILFYYLDDVIFHLEDISIDDHSETIVNEIRRFRKLHEFLRNQDKFATIPLNDKLKQICFPENVVYTENYAYKEKVALTTFLETVIFLRIKEIPNQIKPDHVIDDHVQ